MIIWWHSDHHFFPTLSSFTRSRSFACSPVDSFGFLKNLHVMVLRLRESEDFGLPGAMKRGFYEQANSASFINLNVCVCDSAEGSIASRSFIKPHCILNDKWNFNTSCMLSFSTYTHARTVVPWNIRHGPISPRSIREFVSVFITDLPEKNVI